MFKNYYRVSIKGRNIKSFIKMLYHYNIFLDSVNINGNSCILVVDEENMNKLSEIKTSYDIEIIEEFGRISIVNFFKKNKILFISLILGLVLVFVLSNVIFEIEVRHSDSNIRGLVLNELKKHNIDRYKFIRSYDYIQKVKDDILSDNKDKIEWIDIERIGTKYVVKIEKRVINDVKEEKQIRNVVAKRNGIVKEIVAYNGEVIKKINDYVNPGDILISGEIHKGEDVLDRVSADGDVYAEVWYKARVTLPINYYEKRYTGNEKNKFNISFLSMSLNLFDNNQYNSKESSYSSFYSDFFDIFKVGINNEKEILIVDQVNLMIDDNYALLLAKNKIEERLGKNEYIISQKKLKTILNNSTIIVEVFFKVYENITSYSYINEVIE